MKTMGTQQRKSVATMNANRLAMFLSCCCCVHLSPIFECEMVKNMEMYAKRIKRKATKLRPQKRKVEYSHACKRQKKEKLLYYKLTYNSRNTREDKNLRIDVIPTNKRTHLKNSRITLLSACQRIWRRKTLLNSPWIMLLSESPQIIESYNVFLELLDPQQWGVIRPP